MGTGVPLTLAYFRDEPLSVYISDFPSDIRIDVVPLGDAGSKKLNCEDLR